MDVELSPLRWCYMGGASTKDLAELRATDVYSYSWNTEQTDSHDADTHTRTNDSLADEHTARRTKKFSCDIVLTVSVEIGQDSLQHTCSCDTQGGSHPTRRV